MQSEEIRYSQWRDPSAQRLTCRRTGAPNSAAVGFPLRFARRRPVNGGVRRVVQPDCPIMRSLLLFIALACAATAFAQPKPAASSADDRNQIQGPRAGTRELQPAEPRGTERAPFVVQVDPRQVTEVAAANQKSLWEWILLLASVAAAIAVAIFTGRLWVSTEKLWKASTHQAALLRESVDTTVAAASPYLFPRIVDATSLLIMPDTQKPVRPRFEYVFDNLGKSPAIVTEFTDAFRWLDALPERPFYLEEAVTPTERGFAINAEGHSHNIPCRLVEQITAWPPAATDGNRKFFFIGIVKCDDFLGIHTPRGLVLNLSFAARFSDGSALAVANTIEPKKKREPHDIARCSKIARGAEQLRAEPAA